MADFQAKQRRQNIIVGLFVVVGFTLFVLMLMVFRDLPLFVSRFNSFQVLVYFPEAPGIQKDTPVRFCGVQVGRVLNISDPQTVVSDRGRKTHKVGVTISVDEQYIDIPSTIDVVIIKRSLGTSHIEFQDLATEEPTEFLADKMVLNGIVGTASEFFPPDVQQKLENLVDSITALSDNTNKIVGDAENQEHLKNTFANVETVTAQAAETLKSIQAFSDTGTEQVDILGKRIADVAEQLEGALSDMRQVIAKIDDGQGTAGKLVNDARLYENLLESSQELQMALDQIKQWAGEARDNGIRIKW